MSARPMVEMAAVDLDVAKACSCGREYTRSEWDTLPLVGYVGAASEDDSQTLELRNCRCGSTLGLDVHVSELES